MEALPLVLKKVPNVRLVVAGANHHTRAGYWESIRDAQPPSMPIDFRGYVPEEAIPELYQSMSIVVMPYDSATGSSGPAHQACEFGVPIVCADIEDLRGMASNENMAVRFHKRGDAQDLADQIVTILQSPELQHQMAEHNFIAGVEMTMTSVVKNYLRWFELHKCKRAIRKAGSLAAPRRLWNSALRSKAAAPDWNLESALLAERNETDDRHGIAATSTYTPSITPPNWPGEFGLRAPSTTRLAKGPRVLDNPDLRSDPLLCLLPSAARQISRRNKNVGAGSMRPVEFCAGHP